MSKQWHSNFSLLTFSYRVTYLEDKGRERTKAVIQRLAASYRWCLTGTPRHTNFNEIAELANLLGIYLGTPEELPNTRPGRNASEMTGLESLTNLLETRRYVGEIVCSK